MKIDKPAIHTTDKAGAMLLAATLAEKGVTAAVLSPGSRNAPLLVAFAREKTINCYVIVDERSAAFFALGIAQQSDKPVALICTSGTAVLNYAPAVAEAYYQQIPLLVISADRPEAWIDQDDSQTIRQRDILHSFVKNSYQLSDELYTDTDRWYLQRQVNEAYNLTTTGVKGPIHLNIPLDVPLCRTRAYETEQISLFQTDIPMGGFSAEQTEFLSAELNQAKRILIVAGFYKPDNTLTATLVQWAQLKNVVVLTENISNLESGCFYNTTDRLLAVINGTNTTAYQPDLIISFGGALVSRRVKEFLRQCPDTVQHWCIDRRPYAVDAFQHLTRQLDTDPVIFFSQLLPQLKEINSGYAQIWQQCDALAQKRHDVFLAKAPWCDLSAFSVLMPMIPAGSRLQISNGTSIRYTQLFKHPSGVRCNGNRGVSGIDGSTSTAVGASTVCDETTTLITGDMSFLYDSNGLAIPDITPRFKLVVMQNGGGGIFRYISGPSELDELESCFETAQEIQVSSYATLHNFAYFEANSATALQTVLPRFYAEDSRCAILCIKTPRLENAEILKAYFDYLKTEKQ